MADLDGLGERGMAPERSTPPFNSTTISAAFKKSLYVLNTNAAGANKRHNTYDGWCLPAVRVVGNRQSIIRNINSKMVNKNIHNL